MAAPAGEGRPAEAGEAAQKESAISSAEKTLSISLDQEEAAEAELRFDAAGLPTLLFLLLR